MMYRIHGDEGSKFPLVDFSQGRNSKINWEKYESNDFSDGQDWTNDDIQIQRLEGRPSFLELVGLRRGFLVDDAARSIFGNVGGVAFAEVRANGIPCWFMRVIAEFDCLDEDRSVCDRLPIPPHRIVKVRSFAFAPGAETIDKFFFLPQSQALSLCSEAVAASLRSAAIPGMHLTVLPQVQAS